MSTSSTWPAGTFLGSLSEVDRTELLALGTRCVFRRNEHLIREDDRTTHVIVLLEGLTKATTSTDIGRDALLSIRVAGDVVGEMAAIDNSPRSATVTACTAVTALIVRQADLGAYLGRRPKAALALQRVSTQRLRWANRRRAEFGAYPVKVRLARILLELADSLGEHTPDDAVHIGVELTQPEWAGLTGAAEVTIHKALKELREDGLLVTARRSMTLLDPARLRKVAGFPPA